MEGPFVIKYYSLLIFNLSHNRLNKMLYIFKIYLRLLVSKGHRKIKTLYTGHSNSVSIVASVKNQLALSSRFRAEPLL